MNVVRLSNELIWDHSFFQDLLNVVRPTTLISPDQILDAIKAKNESRDMDLQYRGYLSKLSIDSKGIMYIGTI